MPVNVEVIDSPTDSANTSSGSSSSLPPTIPPKSSSSRRAEKSRALSLSHSTSHPSRSLHLSSTSGSEYKRRERDISSRTLAKLLAHEEKRTAKLERALLDTAAELRVERVRADDAVRLAAQRVRAANAEAQRARETLVQYRAQLDAAQREIFRAQAVCDGVDQARVQAEAEAGEARDVARRLVEERLVENAREEGRRSGYRAGLERGRELAYAMRAGLRGHEERPSLDDRERDDVDGDVDDESEEDGYPEFIRGVPVAVTEPEGEETVMFGPTSTPSDSPAQPSRRFPSRPPSRPSRPPSRLSQPAPPMPNPPPPALDGRPVPFSPKPRMPHPDVDIPPEGWIPQADADSIIRLPPPHELTRTPRAESPPLPPLPPDSARSRSPSPNRAGFGRPRHHRRESGTSVGSTTISQLDLVRDDPQTHLGLGRKKSAAGLSVIPESVSSPGSRRQAATPAPEPMPEPEHGHPVIPIELLQHDDESQRNVQPLRPRPSRTASSMSMRARAAAAAAAKTGSSSSHGSIEISVEPPSRPSSFNSRVIPPDAASIGTERAAGGPTMLSASDAERPAAAAPSKAQNYARSISPSVSGHGGGQPQGFVPTSTSPGPPPSTATSMSALRSMGSGSTAATSIYPAGMPGEFPSGNAPPASGILSGTNWTQDGKSALHRGRKKRYSTTTDEDDDSVSSGMTSAATLTTPPQRAARAARLYSPAPPRAGHTPTPPSVVGAGYAPLSRSGSGSRHTPRASSGGGSYAPQSTFGGGSYAPQPTMGGGSYVPRGSYSDEQPYAPAAVGPYPSSGRGSYSTSSAGSHPSYPTVAAGLYPSTSRSATPRAPSHSRSMSNVNAPLPLPRSMSSMSPHPPPLPRSQASMAPAQPPPLPRPSSSMQTAAPINAQGYVKSVTPPPKIERPSSVASTAPLPVPPPISRRSSVGTLGTLKLGLKKVGSMSSLSSAHKAFEKESYVDPAFLASSEDLRQMR